MGEPKVLHVAETVQIFVRVQGRNRMPSWPPFLVSWTNCNNLACISGPPLAEEFFQLSFLECCHLFSMLSLISMRVSIQGSLVHVIASCLVLSLCVSASYLDCVTLMSCSGHRHSLHAYTSIRSTTACIQTRLHLYSYIHATSHCTSTLQYLVHTYTSIPTT